MKNNNTEKRIENNKVELLKLLEKVPIVQLACEKSGVSRATYYRWRKIDDKFANEADEVIQKGKHFISDMAESQLISQIKAGNMTAIIFWLKYNHQSYGNRLELTARIDNSNQELSKEQKTQLDNALKLGALISINSNNDEN